MSARGRLRAAAVALAIVLAIGERPAPAAACNACVEDRIAATWDWQVVTEARRLGRTVVFTGIRGRFAPDDERLRRRLLRVIAGTAGVVPASVRVSLSPPGASFACDPVRHPPRGRVAAINRRLSPPLALEILRIGAPGGPPGAAPASPARAATARR